MIDDPNQVANFVLNFYWNFCFENTVAHLAVKAYCTSESKLNSKAAEYIYIPRLEKNCPHSLAQLQPAGSHPLDLTCLCHTQRRKNTLQVVHLEAV